MKKINIKKSGRARAIKAAVKILKNGGVIIYPTETFYGLGADATDRQAVARICRIKGREKKKPLPFLVSSLAMMRKYLAIDKIARRLARKYWPGPLSLVLPATTHGKKILGRADGGVRISGCDFATALVGALGKPVISTSANPAGRQPARSAREIEKLFSGKIYEPDLLLDAGRLRASKGSTFVDLTGKRPKILRQGDLKISLEN